MEAPSKFTGSGKIPSSIRDLQTRMKRLEPSKAVGTVATVYPDGVHISERTGLAPKKSRQNQSTAPRYR